MLGNEDNAEPAALFESMLELLVEIRSPQFRFRFFVLIIEDMDIQRLERRRDLLYVLAILARVRETDVVFRLARFGDRNFGYVRHRASAGSAGRRRSGKRRELPSPTPPAPASRCRRGGCTEHSSVRSRRWRGR